MTHYYFSLLLGLLGFFIGTSSHITGTDYSSPSIKKKIPQTKRSGFYSSDHIIKIQSGEDATTRSNQAAHRVSQTTDQAAPLQQNHISHQGNYPSNQQHKRKIVMYQILKNGVPMKGTERKDIKDVINLIRWFELRLNRAVQHSPYTIDKIDQIWSSSSR